ncbi:MAG TPA: preprotein translocase subunit YajC [Aggregatilineales bacterium]|nr:preprotein translocase subunit YajC [Aggregatilineales bacterium]
MQEFAAFSVVIILALAAYWSMIVYPRQRAFKKHNQYVLTLQPGDEVITAGGIIGTISSMDAESGTAMVKVADGVELKVLTAALSRPYVPEEIALSSKIGVEPEAEAQANSRA